MSCMDEGWPTTIRPTWQQDMDYQNAGNFFTSNAFYGVELM